MSDPLAGRVSRYVGLPEEPPGVPPPGDSRRNDKWLVVDRDTGDVWAYVWPPGSWRRAEVVIRRQRGEVAE